MVKYTEVVVNRYITKAYIFNYRLIIVLMPQIWQSSANPAVISSCLYSLYKMHVVRAWRSFHVNLNVQRRFQLRATLNPWFQTMLCFFQFTAMSYSLCTVIINVVVWSLRKYDSQSTQTYQITGLECLLLFYSFFFFNNFLYLWKNYNSIITQSRSFYLKYEFIYFTDLFLSSSNYYF